MASRIRWLAVATFTLLLAPIVRAEPTEAERTLAESLFQDAKALMKQGDYSRACPKLQESYRLDPVGGTIINLADCTEHLGKWATALTYFEKARAVAAQAHRDDRVRIADDRLAVLRKKVARLVVRVPAPSEGLAVSLDGVQLAAPAWGSAVMIDPGKHAVDAKAPGKADLHLDVVVLDAPETKTLDLPTLADAPSATSAKTIDVAASESPSSSRRTVGLAVGALGVASLGLGTYFLVHGSSLKNRVNDDPHAPDVHDTVASQHTAITVAEVGLGVGVAAIGTAVWLIATSPSAPRRATGARVTPLITANGGGLSVGGAW